MTQTGCSVPLRSLAVLLAGLVAAPGLAQAQDSFVREADFLSGRPLLSVLGAGLGTREASLTVEFSCPGAEAWSVELRGAAFPDGAPITLDLGGSDRGWHEVRLLTVQRPEADRLRLDLDEASFRAALARARPADAPPQDSAAVLQIGRELGVAIGLDMLAREIGALARDCEAPARAPARAGVSPMARYAR